MVRLNPKTVYRTLRYAPSLDLVYVMNQKAACTTIIKSLWLAEDRTRGTNSYRGAHRHDRGPFINIVDVPRKKLEEAQWFTVVRDPYARLLSAYLDKIVPDSPPGRWFTQRAGRRPKNFRDFVEKLSHIRMETMNPHFRAQYLNVLYPYVRWDFIGRVEAMDQVSAYLASRGVEMETHSEHATGAAELLSEHYDDATLAGVTSLYRVDFDLFGYPRRRSPLETPSLPGPVPATHEYLLSMARG